jgi:hypothetical protein
MASAAGGATPAAAHPAAAHRVLLVTADDLGYAPERDLGIVRGFETGIITQASVSRMHSRAWNCTLAQLLRAVVAHARRRVVSFCFCSCW